MLVILNKNHAYKMFAQLTQFMNKKIQDNINKNNSMI